MSSTRGCPRLDARYIDSHNSYKNAELQGYAPAGVIYPEDAQDFALVLKTIKAICSRFAIKAAGHNTNRLFSSVNNGALLDLTHMTSKSYDESTTLTTYEPGSTWSELYDFYLPYGRMVIGGMSYLSPPYGMACESFRELEVVLPSGDIVKVSSTENPDFFFGLRSGVNTDPKAAVLMNLNILTTPDLEFGLDQACVMFLVYDRENPGDAFANFTAIPYLINTLGPRIYPEFTNLPIPKSAVISRADKRLPDWGARADDNSCRTAFDHASKTQGGNATEMPDGPSSFKAFVDGTPDAEGLPCFLNEAHVDQATLTTFSVYSRLQQITQKYNPDKFFVNKTGA
ncbi:FAD-binding domain-containing protein [Xylariaceae sp. FL1651]|nr:FAD-binding domain-containing protein [Xylariaceae sp. FL1651]